MNIAAASGYKLPLTHRCQSPIFSKVWVTLIRNKLFYNPHKPKHYLYSESDFLEKNNLRGIVLPIAQKPQLMRRKYEVCSNWSLMTCCYVMLTSIDKRISASDCYLINLSLLSVGPPIPTVVFVADSVLGVPYLTLVQSKIMWVLLGVEKPHKHSLMTHNLDTYNPNYTSNHVCKWHFMK